MSALLFLPGVGAVAAIGAAAAATLGAAGALGGAAAGEALENALDNGLPVDEQYLYEDALRHGRIVITIEALDAGEAGALRSLLLEAGAESIDKAREHWWSSLKSAEQAEFDSGESADHEPAYRFGFEAAQSLRARRKSFDEALPYLRAYFPDLCHLEAFRRGYEDGRLRQEALQGHQ